MERVTHPNVHRNARSGPTSNLLALHFAIYDVSMRLAMRAYTASSPSGVTRARHRIAGICFTAL
jgi:hypothetical protein